MVRPAPSCLGVSIHASAWEATCLLSGRVRWKRVSIHASAWEATSAGGVQQESGPVSIHASAWEATDDVLPAVWLLRGPVSIHASAWEASATPAPRLASAKFQSTPPRGRRRQMMSKGKVQAEFQSTPPRGRRRARRVGLGSDMGFNPRLRVGGDLIISSGPFSPTQFQSTPPRGRRRLSRRASCWPNQFQSTPPRGRRPAAVP